jgi:fucose 4-O-acetylase-like acetyltransferase
MYNLKRENWVDWAKTILIFLMVVGHGGNKGLNQNILQFIYIFHIPAFFILSGYLFKINRNDATNKGKFADIIKKNFNSLIIPMLIFSVIGWFWYWFNNLILYVFKPTSIFLNLNFDSLIWKPVLGLWVYDRTIATPMCGVFWFVATLFFIRILASVLLKFNNNYIIFSINVFSIILIPCFPPVYDFLFYSERILMGIPFFLTGYLIKKINLFEYIKHSRGTLKFLILLLLFMLAVFMSVCNGRIDVFDYNFGNNAFIFYFDALIGSLFLFILCQIIPIFKQSIQNILYIISINTIIILGLHRIVMKCLDLTFFKFFTFDYSNFIKALFIVLILYYPMLYINRYFPMVSGHKK